MIPMILRRLARLPLTLLATSLLIFGILALGPSPLAQLREFADLSPADLARFAHANGLDRSLPQQYLRWLGHFLTGHWGQSIYTFQPAAQMIFQRVPLTLTIAAGALLLSVGIGVPLGALLAVRAHSHLDRAANVVTLALLAMPGFLLAMLLQLFAVRLRDWTGHALLATSDVPDAGHDPVEWSRHLLLPIVTLALTHLAVWVRYQRSELLGVLGQEYVKAARAKGLPERTILLRHALRNALLPIVTLIAADMGKLVAGAVIVEAVFNLPGIGTLLLNSVNNHDTTVVLDILMLVGTMIVLSNLAADLLHGVLDPRVRES